MEKVEGLGEINVPNIIEVLHRKTRRIHRLEDKLNAIKKHRSEFSASRHIEWIHELDRILEDTAK